MKALLSTCLFLALFSPVASLRCASCLNLFGPCVNPEPQDCKAGEDNCISLQFEVSLLPVLKTTFKSCGPAATCQKGNYPSTTMQNVRLQSTMDCCNTDMCNQDTNLRSSIPKLAPNLLYCPGCYSLGTNNCKSNALIPCYGEQTQCVNASGFLQLNGTVIPLSMSFAIKACTTPNTCTYQLPLEFSNNGNIFKVPRMNCTRATFSNSTPTNGIVPGR